MQTALNKHKHGAPFTDSAQLKLCKESVVVSPLFLARLGYLSLNYKFFSKKTLHV